MVTLTQTRARLRPRAQVLLPLAVLSIVALTIADGLHRKLGENQQLGAALPPFVMRWSPSVGWPCVLAVALSLAIALNAPRAISEIRSAKLFALASYVATLALGLSINAARAGESRNWWYMFAPRSQGSHEGGFEYLPGLPVLRAGVHHFLSDYQHLLPSLPTHAKGNPPGPLLAMHALALTTPGRLAAACIVIGALTTPLAYGLGRTLGDEQQGRRAAALTAFSPAVLLFGFTSVDFVFAALGAAIAWGLVSRGRVGLAAGCALAALGSFSSWLLLAIPVWAVVTVLVRDGVGRAIRVGLCAGLVVLGLNLVLWLWQGYDPLAVVNALRPLYAHGTAADRPWAFWVLGSPAAWLAMLGIPIAWLLVRSLAARDSAAIGLATVIVVTAVAGFTKAETERIWLPFVPLACASAAAFPIRRLTWVLLALAVQAIAVELVFSTIW